jgi:putative ABC transport system substrate-binding protein
MTAAKTTPIVAVDLESDPVASGFVRSLGRPETNMSGIWLDLPELAGKQIQFLRETVPGLSRLGVRWDDRVSGPQFTAAQTAARASAIGLHAVAVHAAGEADGAMKRLLAERPQAILVLTAPAIFGGLSRIAQLSIQHRIPSISPFSNYPATGGLMAYGPDFATLWQQVAAYVDRVLRGARIGDLPVERPSKFVLIVNLKTAEASRLSMPESLVLRADEVIK